MKKIATNKFDAKNWGSDLHFGEGCEFPEYTRFGENCLFSNLCKFGPAPQFGKDSQFGEGIRIDGHLLIGEVYSVDDDFSYIYHCRTEDGIYVWDDWYHGLLDDILEGEPHMLSKPLLKYIRSVHYVNKRGF